MHLIKNVLTPLAKSVLISLGLTAEASAIHAAIQKENVWIRHEMNDIMKIIKSPKDAGLLKKSVSETIQN